MEVILSNEVCSQLSLSITQAARLTNISRSQLYQLMAAKILPFVKIGRRRLIREYDLRALLEQYLVSGKGAAK
jgi:excisionase family DNA binding protein